jgi:uncharacterized protein (DUF2384 family)
MSFTYEFINTPLYLEVTLKGVMNKLQDVLEFGVAVKKYHAGISAPHILIDERELVHALSAKELLQVAEHVVTITPASRKFAIAGSPEDAKQRDLFAGFAATMDLRMCSFENMEEAKQWLQKP